MASNPQLARDIIRFPPCTARNTPGRKEALMSTVVIRLKAKIFLVGSNPLLFWVFLEGTLNAQHCEILLLLLLLLSMKIHVDTG